MMSNPRHIVGMDFGTTNSGMAVFDGHKLQLVPLDDSNRNPAIARTALYITNDQHVHIGREATRTYLAQNTGRPIRMERVWVGEIEVRGADMYYVDDLYLFTDVFSPGRLFLSIKSGLRELDYQGTVVGQFYYALEDLIALYLTVTKMRAERFLGHELREVVLGRPVRFAFQPEQDKLAQARLLDAAFRAGYERVYMQPEPIAAAYHYAQTAEGTQNILVFDFGGGTLDLTVMHVAPKERRILSTGGLPVAGDIFDQKLVRAKLPRHFGEGSTYRTPQGSMPIPSWIYDVFSDWQHVLDLQTPERRAMLAEMAASAERPAELNALISLVSNNYALQMFEAAEQAKRRLSDDMGTLLKFAGPNFDIRQLVTRTDFEIAIREEVEGVRNHLQEVVARAGLRSNQIDVVVRTGGSAEIPIFRRLLAELFPSAAVRELDPFSSVTSGLGVVAHEVATGQLDLPAFTPADLPAHVGDTHNRINRINLRLLQSRVALREESGVEPALGPRLLLLANGNHTQTLPWPPPNLADFQAQQGLQAAQWASPLVVDYDEQLLLVTSNYRFVRLTARQLDDLTAIGMSLQELYHLRPQEEVCAICRWAEVEAADWLTLVTSRGYGRAYRLDTLRPLLATPAPYSFDEALPGVPVALLAACATDSVVLFNNQGRAIRAPLSLQGMRVRGLQLLSWREGERVMGAFLAGQPSDTLLLATADAHGRTLPLADVPVARKNNERPPLLVSRKTVCGLTAVGNTAAHLLTTQRLIPVNHWPPATTKTAPLGKTTAEEQVLAVIGATQE